MSVMMLRAEVKENKTTEVEEAAKKMFAAIDAARPDGVRYASVRVGDSSTFVILLHLADGRDNSLAQVPEFGEFQAKVKDWVTKPPVPEQLSIVGSYNLF